MLVSRIYQKVLKGASGFVAWKMPVLVKGSHIMEKAVSIIDSNKHNRVLIVTDNIIYSLGLTRELESGLNDRGIKYCIYKDTVANPTVSNVLDAVKLYRDNECDGIIAIGGGSAIDCGKGVGAKIARPNKELKQMRGLLKVGGNTPMFYAIPTTAGTGSETTIASVITDDDSHVKYAISDFNLMPNYAILDASLTVGLPPNITAWTGIDALTHAIEAYIGQSNTRKTLSHAELAIAMIDKYLYRAYIDGNDLEAREKMQLASFYAGVAFTRAYVGNVHAIAHAIGGKYSIPHGLANAIVLPYVLEYYGKSVYGKLAKIADILVISEIGDSREVKAKRVISYIRELNATLQIPTWVTEICESDIDRMVEMSYNEATPLYPSPKMFTRQDFKQIYIGLRG